VVVNVATGKAVRNLTFGKPDESPAGRGAISPDGRLVAVTAPGRPPSVWEVTTGKRRFEFDAMPAAEGAVFSADGRRLAFWDGAGNVVVFDLRFGIVARRLQTAHPDGELAVAFS